VADRICVAQIGGAHGIRGEVKLKSFTADPLAVKDYGPLASEDGALEIEIEAVRPLPSLPRTRGRGREGVLVARLRGIVDRNAAERLTNLKLFIPRDRLPPAADDEFYHIDLVGLAAETVDGTRLGTIVAVHDFGAGDILELQPEAGGATLMVPFTDTFVPRVDIAGGRIIVAPPPDAPAKENDASSSDAKDER
jgi:16S rRNA processing protein RimM